MSDRENMNKGIKEKFPNPLYSQLSRKIKTLRDSMDLSHQGNYKLLFPPSPTLLQLSPPQIPYNCRELRGGGGAC